MGLRRNSGNYRSNTRTHSRPSSLRAPATYGRLPHSGRCARRVAFWPWVCERRIVEESFVCQALEEGEHLSAFLRAQLEAADQWILERVGAADACVLTCLDRAAASGVVIQHVGECREAAVV